ncbi:uncharacterized protein [Physcomitrium patens]|uniref:Glabrous enhancer-binding protein-like DBD domain-containing protein n=1 Tax=Physcomitrium patens TaxID=3218 RepID=A0A7I4CZG4_PHYPA|nr:eukaryotic translation initiation factor 5B-like isoform X2 [Physcomitrium patens]XP_024368495.1 eukaryotic translation initiation factor 5B-like isoform X2 [Physcomitrium patens]|eukprot:XP_024368494.1 eukaryotic translation initiation factor 5B-like isoform X2 [Physcomitrella patens]
MDKNPAPPKPKPPVKDSDEESETSDEETEDEDQAEGGSEYESESDESTDTTKKKLTSILPTKQQLATKAAVPGSPAKRTREANGKKGKEDEPLSKKKKPEVATPAAKSAPKPVVPQSDKKKQSASKTEKAKPTPREKASKDTADKDDKKSSKRKAPSSAAKSDGAKSTSSRSEEETPQKASRPSRPWSPEEEIVLSKELQLDRYNDVYGATLPASRADQYWERLMNRLPFMDRYDPEQRTERLCEKVRRMRLRYEALLHRIQAGETNVWKSDHEGVLWRMWHTIWGPHKATQAMLSGEDEGEEDEEEEEDDDEEEEDEEDEEVEPMQAKGRQSAVANATPQKRAEIKKKPETSSDEQVPAKGTPLAVKAAPVAQAVPAARATEASAVTGNQPSAPKPVATKGPTPTAMEVDVNSHGKDASQRVAAYNGHVVASALVEQAAKIALSDEIRAENLAFLRDLRGTCVKMVEEARTQSFLISERMLEETRAKATQIVEEAREKSSQIMEELRLVAERLGAIAGHGGRMNGPGIGSWTDFPETSFPGRTLGLPIGDQTQLEDKWREQSEAEQGLLLQRLQLVQEQARVQQEGIRLKINLQKQQAKDK